MDTVLDPLRDALAGKYPLVYVCSPEEERVLDALQRLLPEFAPKGKLSTCTCVDGLDSSRDAATRDPVAAIQSILRSPHEGFYVLKDLSAWIDRPEVIRVLRDAYYALRKLPKTCIVILSPVLNVPELLEKEIRRIELLLPSAEEIAAHIREIVEQSKSTAIPKETLPEVALSLRGLTLNEAGHVMHRILSAKLDRTEDLFNELMKEKKIVAGKTGFLEFVPNHLELDQVGGLGYLKEWAVKRKDLFTREVAVTGLPVPKGVLIMGISGCGKSMSAKAIAALWRVPLFRLDMNLVFSEMYGNAQAAFHKALKTVESIAPAVLWIDEIESALGMTVEEATNDQALIFSSFLTWMQERPPLIFVAATANRIHKLPAEIIRKGRFDEVFFCDLPTENERREVILANLRAGGAELPEGDIGRIVLLTEGWSGAEIEQAIISARIDARQEARQVALDDIRMYAARMVPLSTTMAEQIRAIRSWAYSRATRASKERPKPQMPGM